MERVDLKELTLKKVEIEGNIIGKFGSFSITQKYVNNTNKVLEVGYTFPIVDTATVVGFEIKVGEKILKGICKEKEEAKKEYAENLVIGNSAYMMEQETGNTFKMSIGKIDKGEEVIAIIKYIDKFEIVDNTIQMLIPTLVPPRYNSRVTENLEYGKVNYTVDFKINVDKSIKFNSIMSPTHVLSIKNMEEANIVEVVDYDLSKDFKLNINLKNELVSSAITSKTRDGKDLIYLSFMPEIEDTYEDEEKEYIFIVDVSGSMQGKNLQETKHAVIECLKQLDIGDRFNIIPFSSNFSAMEPNSIEFNPENLEKAISFVNGLRAYGGTEILKPIKFALYEKDTDKIVMLFTDGEVGNEDEIISFVDKNIGGSRLFSFGIDSNVNSDFIKELAKVGKGKHELIHPGEKIDDAIIRTFARIQTPLLEDVKVDYDKNKLNDEIKEDSRLFNYEFFNVFAQIDELVDDIILKGKIKQKEYSWKISKDEIRKTDVDLEVLFAKQQIERVEEYIRKTHDKGKIKGYEKVIVDLATKYNINSKYTAFITINEREDKILDVPDYEETILSDGFLEEGEVLYDAMPRSKPKRAGAGYAARTSKIDLSLPTFLKCGKLFSHDTTAEEFVEDLSPKSNNNMEKQVLEYFKIFINKDNKSLITYLLFAIFFECTNQEDIYDCEKLLEFLKKHKDELQNNKRAMELAYFLYYRMTKNKSDLFELLNNGFKKMIETNCDYTVRFKRLEKNEIEKIVNENKIEECIDDILESLIR